jgi:hypothetical protein
MTLCVSTHSMTPFQGCSRIKPVPVVVRSNVGSWNMSTMPSDVAWTSAHPANGLPIACWPLNW